VQSTLLLFLKGSEVEAMVGELETFANTNVGDYVPMSFVFFSPLKKHYTIPIHYISHALFPLALLYVQKNCTVVTVF
jgi:hypothetical protein